MTARILPKPEWHDYFDRVSKRMRATSVDTSVDGLDLGDQLLTSKALLEGITYEPKSETLTFYFQGLSHDIPGPREVCVDDGAEGLRSVVVVDADGHKQIAMFHDLLPLPPT